MTMSADVVASDLVGRVGELARLTAFLDEAARAGAALLLAGEPGVGKTALLDAATDRAAARGIRVIRGGGVEYESEISFSGLHQLVGPLRAELARLPEPARGVLEVALGFGAGPTPADMAILNAAHALFVAAAREQPLLLVVDDVHVLDRASWCVISFLARRTCGHRLGVLAAVRTGIAELPYRLRLPELPLAPLPDPDAISLLSRRFTTLPRRVLVEVARQAQGNPLALLEFGALASAAHRPLAGHFELSRQLRRELGTPQRRRSLTAAAAAGDACAIHCRMLFEWAASRGLGRLESWAHLALTRAALGCSDFESAYTHASAITRPGELPPFHPEALWTAFDLVEAALNSGRPQEARRHAAALREAGVARISPRLALATKAVTAMTASPPEATRLFAEALALPGIEQWPFEVARTRLAYGEHLRRRTRRAEARTQLAAARELFERLGATPWAARAGAELRATGTRRTGESLTPQELEVAELAAAGLPTKEIAARLVISPRTVSAHLYRVFPKLGIRSRAALRDALTGQERTP
ncbi:LuxR family transcriptional regulator [Actinoplanes sp. TRM 88003]|uniref:LuxR family transcriptional regulator n=1 Tax=Paractinoplanes aksuensis TaxID=2939490 RepID=A0ABT1DZG0_9ACTN|nr:LuxR family transcriptional regulator [Actinoplanes aksuensis]MCO8276264.1 LuxR family transcriptional regulator [Actinoplanes aksuensis]